MTESGLGLRWKFEKSNLLIIWRGMRIFELKVKLCDDLIV